jgi:hypothetical protein
VTETLCPGFGFISSESKFTAGCTDLFAPAEPSKPSKPTLSTHFYGFDPGKRR